MDTEYFGRVQGNIKHQRETKIGIVAELSLALAAGGIFWAHVVGRAALYSLVLMPFLLSNGVNIGLLGKPAWRHRVEQQFSKEKGTIFDDPRIGSNNLCFHRGEFA